MRRTKIIATVGPASNGPEVLAALVAAGVDVFRLNFSHGSPESHATAYHAIRKAAADAGRIVGVMQDLSGPKIRTGPLEGGGPLPLVEGQELRIAVGDRPGGPGRIFTPFAPLVESARAGDRLLLDDGHIELRVVGREAGDLSTETRSAKVEDLSTEARSAKVELVTVVVNGGPLGEKKGINAPGIELPASALTAKDESDLRFGVELGVDFIALSFVQNAGDVRRARDLALAAGRAVPLIAKIERPAAVDNLQSILEFAQGVMVARGDLGLEMPLERVPRVQKEIIRLARMSSRPAIVATQVFESMRTEPRPTRAEVSDAANAVGEGTDAIMLTGETAVGAFPVRAVQMLDRVIREAEMAPSTERLVPDVDPAGGTRHGRALCAAAVTLAAAGQVDAIVAVTREGKTARALAALRPSAPVLAATPTAEIAGRLSLLWGVTPMVTALRDTSQLERHILEQRLVPSGATVVFVNVNPDLTRGDANFLNVQKIG